MKINSTQETEIYIESLDELSELKYCDYDRVVWVKLSFSNLIEIPEVIKCFQNVAGLDLYFNKIMEIPEWINNLKWLCHFDLSDNLIAAVPKYLKKIRRGYINLSGNPVLSTPNLFDDRIISYKRKRVDGEILVEEVFYKGETNNND